jgi:hypothetical protein
MQSMIVLPPTSAHFQPISTRSSPSVEGKKSELGDRTSTTASPLTQPSTLSLFNMPSASNQTSTALKPPPATASFFDQQNSGTASTLFNSLASDPASSSVSQASIAPPSASGVFSSLPTKPAGLATLPNLPSLPPQLAPPLNLPPTLPGLNIPGMPAIPTLNIPHVPPPMQIPAVATAGANPYSAKGALNKKVYDPNIVPTVAAQAPSFTAAASFLNTEQQQQHQPQATSNIFVPPPSSSSSTASTLTTSVSSASLQQLGATTLPTPPGPTNQATSTMMNFNQQQTSSLFSGPPQPQIISNNLLPRSDSSFTLMPPLNLNNGQQFVDPSM